ncbi:hypothetical protein BAX60_11885 [Bacillus subtilis]|nr:hypothetical protein BAX60_11885 [Bacillus subtilis]
MSSWRVFIISRWKNKRRLITQPSFSVSTNLRIRCQTCASVLTNKHIRCAPMLGLPRLQRFSITLN